MESANPENCDPAFQFTRRRFLYIAGSLVAVALVITLLDRPINRGLPGFADYFLYSFMYANCIGWPAWIVGPYIGVRTSRLRPIAQWAVFMFCMAIVAIAGSLLALVVLASLRRFSWSQYWPRFWGGFQFNMVITVVIGTIAFLFESLRYRARYETTRARLSSLESRLQPHFLFNTLNSISALIPEDPAAAERMTERLAALLRFSLDATNRNTVPLERELKVMTDYLEIEQTRFGERLRYSVDVPAELMHMEVPPFSLQTLVENSVKYGGSEIRITAGKGNGRLVLKVWDSGSGLTEDAIMPGHGLDNLRSRLAALWGRNASLEIHRGNAGSTVQLDLPVTLHE